MRNLGLTFLLSLIATVASATPTTVRELFLALPAAAIALTSAKTGAPLTSAERDSVIKEDDEKHGYLVLQTGATETLDSGAVALFQCRDGGKLIVLTLQAGDDTTAITALKYAKGIWTTVTSEVLPTLTWSAVDLRAQEKIPAFKRQKRRLTDSASGTYRYLLPRTGTTIKVIVDSAAYDGPEVVLWTLPFDGAKFRLVAP